MESNLGPILTIIFSAVLSGGIAWFIAERRIKSEPELHRNRILLEMKVDIIKSIQNLLNSMMFNDQYDPEFVSWHRRLATVFVTATEIMIDDSPEFLDNAAKYTTMYKAKEINKREFSEKVVDSLLDASTCIKISTGLIEEPAPVPDELLSD